MPRRSRGCRTEGTPKEKLIVETTEMDEIQGEQKGRENERQKTMGTFAYKGQVEVEKKKVEEMIRTKFVVS